MVFFTCNACGESLKKAQVEKHVSFCRNCQCLSCIDCGNDFWGEEYKTHLKCLTEDEKYGGKGFEAKGFKGDVKQQQWIQRIQEVMKKPNISNNIRNILNQMSTYDNIPRKKAKFQNWIKNSLRETNPAVQDQVWEIFAEASSNEKGNPNNNAPSPSNTPEPESKAAEPSAATEGTKEKKSKRERKEERKKKHKKEKKDLNSEEQPQNGTKKKGKKRHMEEDEIPNTGDEEATRKKRKHRKHEGDDAFEAGEEEAPQANKKRNDSEGEEQEEQSGDDGADENVNEKSGKRGKFNWKGTIKALLRQAPDNELPIKKLRKKVIAQYYVISSETHKSEEELLATFNKKIRKNPTFRVLKERVKLVK